MTDRSHLGKRRDRPRSIGLPAVVLAAIGASRCTLKVQRRRAMLYLTHAPSPPLDAFVEYLWLLSDAPPHGRERIVPSGTLELVINLHEDEIRVYDRDGRCERFPGMVVSGAYGRFFTIDTAEHALAMGVHFRPGGAAPFLGMPAHELADAHIDVHTLWGRRARELHERLVSASTHRERFRLLEGALLAGAKRPLAMQRRVQTALAHLGRGCGVRETADRVGLSHRHFIQVFAAEIGMTPKLFGRVLRFQRALGAIHRGVSSSWAALAIEHGYFDQSHLIRDFVAFTGFSPSDYLRWRRERVKENHVALA